jgi:hypothetical protein
MTFVYISIAILWITVIAAYAGWLPMPNATISDDGSSHF